jgi:hypothetical protein
MAPSDGPLDSFGLAGEAPLGVVLAPRPQGQSPLAWLLLGPSSD